MLLIMLRVQFASWSTCHAGGVLFTISAFNSFNIHYIMINIVCIILLMIIRMIANAFEVLYNKIRKPFNKDMLIKN